MVLHSMKCTFIVLVGFYDLSGFLLFLSPDKRKAPLGKNHAQSDHLRGRECLFHLDPRVIDSDDFRATPTSVLAPYLLSELLC